MDLSTRRETFTQEDQRWLASAHGTDAGMPVTLVPSLFTSTEHYPNGYLPSGLPLGKRTSDGLYGPYSGGTVDEVQTLTVGGSGLTSFTVTFGGQTTTAILAAATAAQVQAALEALSTIGVGNVLVTGADGGPWTLTFRGTLANTNVAQVTTTPTGGSGTVTPATGTAGAGDASSDGRETLVGFLFTDVNLKLPLASVVHGSILRHCRVRTAFLPVPVDANGRTDVAGRIDFV